STDVGGPGAGVETAGVRVINTTLQCWLFAGLGQATEHVLAVETDVIGEAVWGFWSCGSGFISDCNIGSCKSTDDGCKHERFTHGVSFRFKDKNKKVRMKQIKQ